MNWKHLTTPQHVAEALAASNQQPVLLFKHSTRCGISHAALAELEAAPVALWQSVLPHYLDLLAYRPLSAHVAEATGVPHQSPQAILLVKGQVVYTATHYAIKAQDLAQAVQRALATA